MSEAISPALSIPPVIIQIPEPNPKEVSSSKTQPGFYEKTWVVMEKGSWIWASETFMRAIFANAVSYLLKDDTFVNLTLRSVGHGIFRTCQSLRKMSRIVGGKSNLFNKFVFSAPLKEELIFRGVIQEVVLKQIFQRVLSNKPESEKTKEDIAREKTHRVFISSTLFSLGHLVNLAVLPPEYVLPQVVQSFVGGVVLGVVKESSAGIIGSIALHALNNYAAHTFTRLACNAARGM